MQEPPTYNNTQANNQKEPNTHEQSNNNTQTPDDIMHNDILADTKYHSESEDESITKNSTSNPEGSTEAPTSSIYIQKPELHQNLQISYKADANGQLREVLAAPMTAASMTVPSPKRPSPNIHLPTC